MFLDVEMDSDDRIRCLYIRKGQFFDMTVIHSLENNGAGHVCFGVVEGGVWLDHIPGQFSEMLVHVHSPETVSDESAASWVVSKANIGPAGAGYGRFINGTSLVDMTVA